MASMDQASSTRLDLLPGELRNEVYKWTLPASRQNWYITTDGSSKRDFTPFKSIRHYNGLDQEKRLKATCAVMGGGGLSVERQRELQSMFSFADDRQSFTLILDCGRRHNIFTATGPRLKAIEAAYARVIHALNVVVVADPGFTGLDGFLGHHKNGRLFDYMPNLGSISLSIVAIRTARAPPVPNGPPPAVYIQSLPQANRDGIFAVHRLMERALPARATLSFNDPTTFLDRRELEIEAYVRPQSLQSLYAHPIRKEYGLDTLKTDDRLDSKLKRMERRYKAIAKAVKAWNAETHALLDSEVAWNPRQRRLLYLMGQSLARAAAAGVPKAAQS